MCAYNLKCPDSQLPIQKATGLMCSRPSVAQHMKQCSGCAEHQVVAGQLSNGMRSQFVSRYTPEFVQSVLQAFALEGLREVAIPPKMRLVDLGVECLAGEIVEPANADAAPAEEQPPSKIQQAVFKLHKNLGHPSCDDLIRMLKHAGASADAISAARNLSCSVCANHAQPSSALPANVPRVLEFNSQIGLDVKYLPSWKPGKTIQCVNIVDYASSLQVVVPIFQHETSEVVKGVLRDNWIAWAGVPEFLITDPHKTNVGEVVATFCQDQGIKQLSTAAEAHFQLGKVERHGQWFQHIFERVCDQVRPSCDEEWIDCVVQTQTAKNSLISQAGASPFQFVFGRNPRVPHDLLQEEPDVAASDAIVMDSALARSQEIRQTARKSVLEAQDSKALRAALHARPRPHKDFKSGDWVYYWRTQKWENGKLIRGGRWHGAALILGKIGRNLVVAHKRSLFRCAPEQLRFATDDEQLVAEFPESELLGIRNLLERGQFPKSQFTDLIPQGNPPEPEVVQQSLQESAPRALTAAEVHERELSQSAVAPPDQSMADSSQVPPSDAVESPYQPIRYRHRFKAPEVVYQRPVSSDSSSASELPLVMSRPVESFPEEFHEMMHDLGANLLSVPANETSPRGEPVKREASDMPDASPTSRPRLNTEQDGDDALLCTPEFSDQKKVPTFNCYMANFLQKKFQKEISASGNGVELQQEVDVAKSTEWETLIGKGAFQVWTGKKAAQLRRDHPDRFIGSRFVIVEKNDEDGRRVKARLCLQGHSDPDFQTKITSGMCHSPTMSQLARALVLQILVPKKWILCLGDIKGAFLEAGPLNPKFRPLFAKQPQGGIPNIDPEDVLEVTGNVYGSNDAPFNWYHTFNQEALTNGFFRSQFDNCLYFFRDSSNRLTGVLGAHVDDTITGGEGEEYQQAIETLKRRFPYRKWRVGSGEFCGVQYRQDPESLEISYNQKEYAEHLRPISMSKERQRNKESLASDREVAALRAVNGAANWLSSQSRPDLCVQTSFSQQCFPKPKIKDLMYANQLVHRAKQHSDVSVRVRYIPWDELGICFHSDAAFANAKAHATQGGYVLAFVNSKLGENNPTTWSPFCWKSYRLPRVVSSTLSGESQSFSTASALADWMALMITEAKEGQFDLRDFAQIPLTHFESRQRKLSVAITGITDCKSLFDHLESLSAASKCDDKRVAIDIAILKQCMARTGMVVRWCPTELMLADAFTKDKMEPADLIRAALEIGEYQLNPEAMVLEWKKRHRQFRDQRRVLQEKHEAECRQQKLQQSQQRRSMNSTCI